MVEQTAPESNAPGHACPKPSVPKRQFRDGILWACECGLVYVHRFRFNYAGELWEWVPTDMRANEVGGR